MSLLIDVKNKKKFLSNLIPKTKFSKSAYFGFAVALLAAALSAIPNVFPKPLLDATGSEIIPNPIMLVFVLYVINGLFFTGVAKNNNPIKKIGRKAILLLIILGIVESSGTLTYTIGLQETSAINASILVNGETIFAILIGITIFRERLSRNEILPFLLIILGAIGIPLGLDLHEQEWSFSEFVFGDLLIVLSGFFYCLDTFIAKKIDCSISTKRIVHIMSCSGAVFSLVLMFLLEIPFDITLEQISVMSFVGIFGVGMTMIFFVMALRLIGAVRTVLIFSTATVFSVIYSIIHLSESITPFNIISVGIVIFGLYALRNRLGAD